MRVTREKEEFKPVTIVLESQLEVDLLAHILSKVESMTNFKLDTVVDGLCESLVEYSEVKPDTFPDNYVKGSLRIQY